MNKSIIVTCMLVTLSLLVAACQQNPEQAADEAGGIGFTVTLDPALAEQIALQSSGLKQQTYVESLSDREFQILRLLAHGMSVNQIAEQLVISNKTVSTHKTRLMEKMGFNSTADIVRFAMTLGIS